MNRRHHAEPVMHHEKNPTGQRLKHEAKAAGEKVMEKGYNLKSKVGTKHSKANDKIKEKEHNIAHKKEKLAAKGEHARQHIEGHF